VSPTKSFVNNSTVSWYVYILTANRAKSMVTTAVINEDATSNLIRELKEQIAELEKDTKSGPGMST